MFKAKAAFAGFSVNDMTKAKEFYTKTLGLEIESDRMGLDLRLPGGGGLFLYEKENHEPANFTVLNFVVDDIDAAVDELMNVGVKFEHYDDMPFKQDEKGIARSEKPEDGPNIAWFKDPADNVLSVLQS
jgi:catechol 2,3-dioxygenase-like lactoylglutathione lyase family enzyme